MKSLQKGFTLIELIIVIVILGILAATALPRFIDLSGDADRAAIQGVAGAIASGSSINYGVCKLSAGSVNCQAVANCSAVGALLQGGIPPAYSVTAAIIASGATVDCTVFKIATPAITASAPVIGAP